MGLTCYKKKIKQIFSKKKVGALSGKTSRCFTEKK